MMVLRQPMNLSMDHGVMKLDTDSMSLPNLMQDVTGNHSESSSNGVYDSIDLNGKYPTSSMVPSSSTTTLNMTEKTSRTNLYLKGLPEDFTDERLWDLVPDKSQVKSVKAATEDDSKCRGYGFIDFQTCESAQIALRHIQTHYPLFTIKFAKENEKDKTNLYVTNIPKSWTTKDSDKLKEVFEKFGQIQSAFVMVERSSNKSLGIGFVRFANEDDAMSTIESLKNTPLILPTCHHPVEAKFADKHNPETRRRKHQVLTTSNLGLNAAMLGGAGPLLSNFAFTPNSLSGFPSMPQAPTAHPSLAALGLNPASNPGFAGGSSTNLLQATMGLATGSSATTPSVTTDNGGNNLLNSLGVQSGSGQTHGTPQAFSPSTEQLSLIAAGFPIQNLYGLYGNQFYRPSSGNPQHPSNASNQNAITSAILATLNNNASYPNQTNPYSTLVAYQALMNNGTSTNSNVMSVNTNSIYSGSAQTHGPQQQSASRTNLFQNGSVNQGPQDMNAALEANNIIQFQ